MSKAVPNLWPDVGRGAPTLLPWLRLALCAAGRKVTDAFPWIAALCPSWVALSEKYPRRAERRNPRECARNLAARGAQRNAEPGQ